MLRLHSLYDDSFPGKSRALIRFLSDREDSAHQASLLCVLSLASIVSRWRKGMNDVGEVSWLTGTLCSLEIAVPRLHCLQVLVTSWRLEVFANNQNSVGEKLVSRYIGSGMWHILRWLRWVLPAIWGHLSQNLSFDDARRWDYFLLTLKLWISWESSQRLK